MVVVSSHKSFTSVIERLPLLGVNSELPTVMPYSPGNLAALDSNGYASDGPSETPAPPSVLPSASVLSPNGQTLPASFSPLSSSLPPAAVNNPNPPPPQPPPSHPDVQMATNGNHMLSANPLPPNPLPANPVPRIPLLPPPPGFFPFGSPRLPPGSEFNFPPFPPPLPRGMPMHAFSTPRHPLPLPLPVPVQSPLRLMMPSQLQPPQPPVVAPLPVISSMRPATIIRPMGTVQVSIGGQSKSLQVLRVETTTISTLRNDSVKFSSSGMFYRCILF